jgi:hypothetical protein
MGMTLKASRIWIAVAGVFGFAMLMALRGVLSGTVPRSSVAALAFVWLAAALAWAAKMGR